MADFEKRTWSGIKKPNGVPRQGRIDWAREAWYNEGVWYVMRT